FTHVWFRLEVGLEISVSMQKKPDIQRVAICLAALQVTFSLATLSAFADTKPKTLKGGVQETGEREKAPGLNRTDLSNPNPNADPFSGDDDASDEIEAPRAMMKMD